MSMIKCVYLSPIVIFKCVQVQFLNFIVMNFFISILPLLLGNIICLIWCIFIQYLFHRISVCTEFMNGKYFNILIIIIS